MKKVLVLCLVLVMTVAMFASCAPAEEAAPAAEAAPAEEVAEEPAEEAAPAEADQIVLGLSVDQLFESRVAVNDAIKAEAEKSGAKVVEVVADGDAQTQNAQIETLINQQVDALLVCAVDLNTIEVALMKAKNAGIPVIAYDRDLPDSQAKDCFIGPDSKIDGRLAGECMAEQLKDKEGDIVVLELLGALNDQNGIDRSAGFNEAMAALPNVEIIQMPTNWSSDEALAAVQNAFQANPDIAGVFAATDTQVPSIETVLKDLGKLAVQGEENHVVVAGINGSKDGYLATLAGTCDGMVVMNCIGTGTVSVQKALAIIAGEEVEDEVLGGTLYTPENVEANKDVIWGAKGQ